MFISQCQQQNCRQFINEKSLALIVNAILEINFMISPSLTTMFF